MNTVILPSRSASEVMGKRSAAIDARTLSLAGQIVEEVRKHGAAALQRWSVKLGDLEISEPWLVDRAELDAAKQRIDPEVRDLLERTAGQIETFARAQREMFRDVEIEVPGGRAGHRVAPVASAGCYAPGGRFPLPSSVLMTAVTARVAGVERVIVASPKPTDITLAAASIAGADALIAVGGAQAIATLAYGNDELSAVDMIVGPGNRWVTAAKKWVSGDVGIDMLAGPSELVVVADATADPAVVAADLIAQAEHDPDAVPILVALDRPLIGLVRTALAQQLEELPTEPTAREALLGGYAVFAMSRERAAEICDRIAPEHLELIVERPRDLAASIRHYGGLFLGPGSAEVFGDYGIGPNHVLPTAGTARFGAGLSVATFLRLQTFLELDDPRQCVDDAMRLARIEGLEGHARAAEARERGDMTR